MFAWTRNFCENSTQYYHQVPEAPVLPSMQFIFPSSTSMGGQRFCYRRNPSYDDNLRPNGEIVLEQNLTVSDSELPYFVRSLPTTRREFLHVTSIQHRLIVRQYSGERFPNLYGSSGPDPGSFLNPIQHRWFRG
jgi:hypothetical protein